MKWNRANQYLQIGANLGILAGLILVRVQILETNRITSAQFIADDYAMTMSSYDLKVGESLSAALGKAEVNSLDLTSEDLVVVQAYLTREWYRLLRDRAISDTGFKQVNFDLEVAEWTLGNLGNKTALRWWAVHQDDLLSLDVELREAINERLVSEGESHSDFHRRRLEKMMDGRLFPQSVADKF